MNLQTHPSGQISGQVEYQAGTLLAGLQQQNENPVPGQMQNRNVHNSVSNMDVDMVTTRRHMQKQIWKFLMNRCRNSHEASTKKMMDVMKHLEENLFKTATTKEEYLNLDTLEIRLCALIKNRKSNLNQPFQHANSSPSIGTMTPGLQQPEKSSLIAASSLDSSDASNNISTVSSTVYSGGLLPAGNHSSQIVRTGSFGSSSGALYGDYQQSMVFSVNSGGNNMGAQRMTTETIPTPGFNNSYTNDVNHSSNNQSFMNVESTNNVGGFPSVESAIVSQPMEQKQHIGGQNINLGGPLGGIRSTLQQKSYGSLNGPLNVGLGMRGTNVSPIKGTGITEGYLTGVVHGNSPKPMHHHIDQHRQPLMQGAGYGISDASGSGNLYDPLTSVGSTMNNQSLNAIPMQSMPEKNLSSTANQSNVQAQEIPPFQPPPDQFQGQQLIQHPSGERQQSQNELLLKNTFSQSPLSSNIVSGEFHHKSTGKDAFRLNSLSSEESMVGQSDTLKSAEPPYAKNMICRSNNLDREHQFRNQQKWLLLLRHASHCRYPEGQCQDSNCEMVQKLLKHMVHCNRFHCSYLHCHPTKVLIDHYRLCRSASCPVCIPVKHVRNSLIHTGLRSELPLLVNESCKAHDTTKIARRLTQSPVIAEAPEDLQPSIKRVKIEQSSQPLVSESESPVALVLTVNEPPLKDVHHFEQKHESHVPMTCEITEVKNEIPGSLGQFNPKTDEMRKDNLDCSNIWKPEDNSIVSDNLSKFGDQVVTKIEKDMMQTKSENVSVPSESALKSGKPKIKGVSMVELFTPEQVRQHSLGLRQWVGQSKAKAEKNQAMELSMTENSCQLCAVEKLNFEPPPTYCTHCGARIKRNALYYTSGAGETRHYFCIPCYNESRGDNIVVEGIIVLKARMEKKKNDEETEEGWVQCDKCEAWQHQICALFNGRRNDGGQAEYTCPNCYIKEVERGERVPLPQSAVLGAKDLPKTILSDHLEQRLFAKLKQERFDRSKLQGKSFDEVPGAESLVIRVVSSVDKKLDVKPRFLEIFQEGNFPVEFPYKSKVVLLFQKIEGVEVCLFGMYVQEFGSECQQPNHRRVYLSYLDSVKYFRPEVRAVTGEALRTFVYHEILIGYLEYSKMRGFTSCYIWACPPLKGEDYILYCHPETQKTPKSDKLRQWYLSMLKKAEKENIVVEVTNLYDHFLVSTGERKAKVTAARLPYFDGDYWPGAAEDMIFQLQQEEDGRKLHQKGTIKKTITKRALKASGQTDLSGNASKNLLLMHKLGEAIYPMKEDFIMVHLQHACTHCCILMVSGNRWICKQCNSFELCDKCYDAEQKREDGERHPINQEDKHALHPVEIVGVPDYTKDKDEVLESEFFDTRQAFLSLCQGNHYQYDTLRRAKHSSMMVLYHLHNPTAPAFVATCNLCNHDIETGQGWRCETCPEYDVCNTCYEKDGAVNHPHKLTNNPSSDREAQNKEARQLRVMQLRKMLELLVHASQCRSPHCQYPNCRKVRGLFHHGSVCKRRISGGCALCKKMWYLLQLHARACKESQCNVPRCRDLREHMKRVQQQSESRRRAAVNEMMRQRAAEVTRS